MTASIIAASLAAACVYSLPAMAQEGGQVDQETLDRIEALQPFITEATRRFSVPEAWIRAVMAAESGGRTELDGKPITSRAGAMGPMQVMPETYEEMRRRYGLGPDPLTPRTVFSPALLIWVSSFGGSASPECWPPTMPDQGAISSF